MTREWFDALQEKGWTLGLERIRALLQKLGNPQDRFDCIHVAGTNGKGSTCAIISQLLMHSGYQVGVFSSPALISVCDQITINSDAIEEDEFDTLLEQIKTVYHNESYFEVLTALMFLHFANKSIDIAVIEVGLGGRFDSTNVITPLVSVITNVSMDHAEILGDSIEKIAFEKAGIIKESTPLISLAKGKALEVIKKEAKKKKAQLFVPKVTKHPTLSLVGAAQQENASLALEALKQVSKYPIKEVDEALSAVRWPARVQFIEDNVLLDCAHNVAAMSQLVEEVKNHEHERCITVCGFAKDKEYEKMIAQLEEVSDQFVFTSIETERSVDAFDLLDKTQKVSEVVLDPKKALKKARKYADPTDLIVIVGSCYLARSILLNRRL